MDSNYTLSHSHSLSLSLFYLFFILISFGYTHEFTFFFIYLFIFIEFLMIIYIRPFAFCTTLTCLKKKKKNCKYDTWCKIRQQLESNLKFNWIFSQFYLLIYIYILACNPCKHMNVFKIKRNFYYKNIND